MLTKLLLFATVSRTIVAAGDMFATPDAEWLPALDEPETDPIDLPDESARGARQTPIDHPLQQLELSSSAKSGFVDVLFFANKVQPFGNNNRDRPNWVTTETCRGECVPCDKAFSSGKLDGCLIPVPNAPAGKPGHYMAKMSTVAGSTLRSSQASVELKCDPGDIPVLDWWYTGSNVKVSVYWNDALQTTKLRNNDWDACKTTPYKCSAKVRVSPKTGGSNSVQLVVEPLQFGEKAEAYVFIMISKVKNSFTDCEDNKVCLGKQGLAEHWETQESKDLRESMALQWACVQDQALSDYPAHQTVCKRWVNCLKASGRLLDIKVILQARGAAKAPPLAQLASTKSSPKQSAPGATRSPSRARRRNTSRARRRNTAATEAYLDNFDLPGVNSSARAPCKNPFVSDPESWDCACHENMLKKCPSSSGPFDPSCYQKLLCQNPRVCKDWKLKVCGPPPEGDGSIELLIEDSTEAATAGWNCG
jgi:hypothetical protein